MSEKKKEDKISIEGEKVNEIIKKAKAKGKMTYGEPGQQYGQRCF